MSEGIEESRVVPPLAETSYIVRYLTDDPPEMAQRAAALIESATPLSITAVIIAEVAHVLRRVYRQPRERIIDALIDLVRRENIRPYGLDRASLLQALTMCRPSGRVSIPDALIWAEARASGANVVYSFDRQFPREKIKVRERP